MTVVALLASAAGFVAFCGLGARSSAGLLLALLPLLGAAVDTTNERLQTVEYRLRGFDVPLGDGSHAALTIGGIGRSTTDDAALSGTNGTPRLRTPYLASDDLDRGMTLKVVGGAPRSAPEPMPTQADRREAVLTCPAGADLLGVATAVTESGDPWRRGPGTFCNVVELHDGDDVVLYGERRLRFRGEADGWSLGGCVFRGSKDGQYALLDFVVHDDDCRPIPTTLRFGQNAARPGEFDRKRWIRIQPGREGVVAYDVPMKSFLTVRDGRIWVALLDPTSTVQVETTSAPPPSRSAVAAAQADAIWIAQRTFRLRRDRLYEREGCTTPTWWSWRTGPNDCSCDYATAGFCRRIEVQVQTHRLPIAIDSETLHVGLEQSPDTIIALRAASQTDADVERDLDVVYSVGVPTAASDRVLRYPFTLAGGEPVRARFRMAACTSDAASSCVTVETPNGRGTWPLGSTIPVSADLDASDKEDRFAHVFQIVRFGDLWWLACFGAATLLIHGICFWPTLPTRTARAGLVFINVLLSFRVLLAYRVFALYPYDGKGMTMALVALPLVPVAYVAPLARGTRGRGAVVTALVGAITSAALSAAAIAGASSTRRDGLAIAIALLAIATIGGSFRWVAAWIARHAPPLRTHARALLVAAVAALTVTRLALAVVGREAVGGIRVDAVYVPLVFVAIAWVWSRDNWRSAWMPASVTRFVVPFIPVVLAMLPFAAPLIPGGDKGTTLTLLPAVCLVAMTIRALRVPTAVLLAAITILLVVPYGVHLRRQIDVPPVLENADRWNEVSPGRYCPDATREDTKGAFPLERYAAAIDADNIEIRKWEFARPGTARRIGTRAANEVAHALAVLLRYAQGRAGLPFGDGFLADDLRPFPSSLMHSQLSDGLISTLILPDFGTAGLVALLVLFAAWIVVLPSTPTPHVRGVLGALGATSLVSIAYYMAAANVGLLPLTGKDVPFLAVLSGSNIVLSTILCIFAGSMDREPR